MSDFDGIEHEYIEAPLLDMVEIRPVKLRLPDATQTYALPRDVDALGLSHLVEYRDGQPVDVRLPLFPLYILPVLKVYRDELRAAKERIKTLETDVTGLHSKVDKLLGWGSWS